jgi:hypothetical protein
MSSSPPKNRFLFFGILGFAAATAVFLGMLAWLAAPHFGRHSASRLAVLPRVTLWAWERPEYFGDMSAGAAAIAWLDQTIEITNRGVASKPRMQPVTFPSGGVRIAVVRIESTTDADLSDASIDATVRLLLDSAARPGISAFQVDYDARKSERSFYRAVLLKLRRAMPEALPLSMTALASWCAYDDWIRGLPIDEAVPMFFRMEPEWRKATGAALQNSPDFQLREPLCGSSIGLSTREPWPPITEGRRLYLFADSGWSPSAIQSALARTKTP